MELEQLVKLIQTVSESNLTGFRYEAEGVRLSLKKEFPGEICTVQQDSARISSAGEKEGKIITSMLVGTFYAAPAEDAEPFVRTGDRVKKGQTIGIIEAMKLMNEVECEYDGEIAEILVKNGAVVEYGQPLFRIAD